jgi:hypothetical protein
MKQRPIIFGDDMIRAILDGRKTQTRRVAKNVHFDSTYRAKWKAVRKRTEVSIDTPAAMLGEVCPYGQPGDRLWVREKFATHFIWDKLPPGHIDIEVHADCFFYGDGSIAGGCDDCQRGKWRASIHMPRFASRITLEITGVRVERLQDISGEDCAAEGVADPIGSPRVYGVVTEQFAKEQFARLWQSINGPDSWDANPWVWVIEFRRIKP